MLQHRSQHDAASRIASTLSQRTQPQITAYVSDQISRAHLEHGDAHLLALDYCAELVTALRELHVWPQRTRVFKNETPS